MHSMCVINMFHGVAAGLDSFAALNIMEHMALLATLGHTIIATIHQPRSAIWAMFHKVGFRGRKGVG